jgi:hypothetical protein
MLSSEYTIVIDRKYYDHSKKQRITQTRKKVGANIMTIQLSDSFLENDCRRRRRRRQLRNNNPVRR